MPRRLIKKRAAEDVDKAAANIAAFVGSPSKRKSSRPSAGSRRKQYIEEVRERMKRKNWEGMTAGKLVALYWLCHERVYGVTPVEIDKASTWTSAMKQAGSMVQKHFDGDVDRAITFMRWCWTRELEREKWRRDNGKEGRRLSWQNQFIHHHLITDWRAAAMRRQGG